jgi:acetyl-CoA acetyltransferase
MVANFGGKSAIVGIGATEFSKNSGRSELQLACEAVVAALKDCGLKPDDVDAETRALADLCLLLFNSNEFAYVY